MDNIIQITSNWDNCKNKFKRFVQRKGATTSSWTNNSNWYTKLFNTKSASEIHLKKLVIFRTQSTCPKNFDEFRVVSSPGICLLLSSIWLILIMPLLTIYRSVRSYEHDEIFRNRFEEVGHVLYEQYLVQQIGELQTVRSPIICLLLSSFWPKLIEPGLKRYREFTSHEVIQKSAWRN